MLSSNSAFLLPFSPLKLSPDRRTGCVQRFEFDRWESGRWMGRVVLSKVTLFCDCYDVLAYSTVFFRQALQDVMQRNKPEAVGDDLIWSFRASPRAPNLGCKMGLTSEAICRAVASMAIPTHVLRSTRTETRENVLPLWIRVLSESGGWSTEIITKWL
jgi:hypothetical protein